MHRSLSIVADHIRSGQSAPGLERLAATITDTDFARHRHDTYAIGLTVSGVQKFYYRGRIRQCMAGECHILHPDEEHDGLARGGPGFSYRMLYVDPGLVAQCLDGRPLPFVADPIVRHAGLVEPLAAQLWEMDDEIDEFRRAELAVIVTDLLSGLAANTTRAAPAPVAMDRLKQAREMIAADLSRMPAAGELEKLTGLSRWTLARQFRQAFGTSPGRYRTMRQLDRVRYLLMRGERLADAALEAGFADQSHMTRMFKKTYGFSPGKWQDVRRAGRPKRPHRATRFEAAP